MEAQLLLALCLASLFDTTNDDAVEELLFLCVALGLYTLDDDDDAVDTLLDDDDDDDDRSRRGPRGPYGLLLKSDTLLKAFDESDNRWTRQFFRMGKAAFRALCEVLRPMKYFRSKGRKPQRPVEFQVAAFLLYYGANNQHHLSVARSARIGVGTVYLYVRRVRYAIRKLVHLYVVWPAECERGATSLRYKDVGFPGCVGTGDGCIFAFAEAPRVNPVAYWCRKKEYGLNVLLVADDQGYCIYYDASWPASVPDITVLQNSALWKHRDEFFSSGQYILVDKGYSSTPYTLRPFAETEVGRSGIGRSRREFNFQHASVRIPSEHLNGSVKGRFPGLRVMTGTRPDEMAHGIEACIILHNMLLRMGDDPKEVIELDNEEVARTDTAARIARLMQNDTEPLPMTPEEIAELRSLRREVVSEETSASLKTRGDQLRVKLMNSLILGHGIV